ncbi:Gfo/Idh/MocA family oxidoreductase [Enterocloster asparagiformis]|uniref:Gfo/Idh/MocA family protein n=1 Tax=Enterocloster asparagiformis TaxID=333367 RepID=UPI0004BC041C
MRWGILATGSIANKFALTVCSMDSREASLAAVGSRKMDSAREFAKKYHIPAFYDSYEAMAADPQVEAVYISTPNNMHYENCKMCLNAGKHVLCEKPFTTSVAQAEELYRLAGEKGLFIMEAFWIRFLPQLQHMMGLIAQGVIGRCAMRAASTVLLPRGPEKTGNSTLTWAAERCWTSVSTIWAFYTW